MFTRPLRYAVDATNAIFSAASTARSCLGAAYFGFVAGVTRGSEFGRLSGPVPDLRRVTHIDRNLLLLKEQMMTVLGPLQNKISGGNLIARGGRVTSVSEQSRRRHALIYNSSPGRLCDNSPITDARQYVRCFSQISS